jgi:TRAP-type C4-dicarboxylate transport system permease small subunit
MLQGIALFWGVALATYYGSHICVDIVWEHLRPAGAAGWTSWPPPSRAFLAPLAWMVWVKVAGTGTQGTMDLRMPLVWFYSVAAVGAGVAGACWRWCASCSCGRDGLCRCMSREDAHGS